MIRAYSEFYLSDAKKSLANMLDYAVYDCGIKIDEFADLFVLSGFSKRFETGDPAVISGISGTELAQRVLQFATFDELFPPLRLYGVSGRQPIGRAGLLRSTNGTADAGLRIFSTK